MVWGRHHCGTANSSVLWVSYYLSAVFVQIAFEKNDRYLNVYIVYVGFSVTPVIRSVLKYGLDIGVWTRMKV